MKVHRLPLSIRRSAWPAGLCLLALSLTALSAQGGPKRPASDRLELDVLFSPGGGCEDRIVEEIGEAEESIRVQAYHFTSKPIGEALAAAKKRGVDVQVILDKSQEKQPYGRWRVLKRDGVKVFFDGDHKIANSKIMLIDRRTIITGSYNFTKAAEQENAENVLFIRGAEELMSKYIENFDKHRTHARAAS